MKNTGFLKVVCLICFALICTSCATTTRMAPENMPDEDLVVVGTGYGVIIVGIDSQEISGSSTVILEPGIHRIAVRYSGQDGRSVGSTNLKLYFSQGVKYSVNASIDGYTIEYSFSIDAPVYRYSYNPFNDDLPDFSQEAMDGVRIFEDGVPAVAFTPIANIKLEYGNPIMLDDPEYEDEVKLFKQYAFDMGADAVFLFGHYSKGGLYPTDNFYGCAVKLEGELPE